MGLPDNRCRAPFPLGPCNRALGECSEKPNFVLIFADDLAYGDLGVYPDFAKIGLTGTENPFLGELRRFDRMGISCMFFIINNLIFLHTCRSAMIRANARGLAVCSSSGPPHWFHCVPRQGVGIRLAAIGAGPFDSVWSNVWKQVRGVANAPRQAMSRTQASSVNASALRAPSGIGRNRFIPTGTARAIRRAIGKARPGANKPQIIVGRSGGKPRIRETDSGAPWTAIMVAFVRHGK